MQAQGDKLNDAERASRAKTIDDKKKQLDRDAEDAQNDFQQEMQELYNALASKVYDVLASYAAAAGIHAGAGCFPAAELRCSMPATATNITKDIIDAYNAKSGVPAPPAQPAAGETRPSRLPGLPPQDPRLLPTRNRA